MTTRRKPPFSLYLNICTASFVTFRVSRIDDAKCILVTAVCVSVCVTVPRRIPTLLHGPGCNLGNGRGCHLVEHYWAFRNWCTGFIVMTT